jgi:hypothetical protein
MSKNGCSEQGYTTALLWKEFFNQMNLSNPIFYAFGFSMKKCDGYTKNRTNKCPLDVNNIITNDAENCKNFNYKNGTDSQRAFLTICPLATSHNSDVITEFTVGEEKDLVKDIYKQDIKSDIVIVWEHHAIIDIFNQIAKYFKSTKTYTKWSKDNDSYNLLFTIPRNTTNNEMPSFRVQCFNKITSSDCSIVPKFITDIDPTSVSPAWILPSTNSNIQTISLNKDRSSISIIKIVAICIIIAIILVILILIVQHRNLL